MFHGRRRPKDKRTGAGSLPDIRLRTVCGWKTRSMFDRYNVIDEQDLTQAVTKHFNGTVAAR